MEHLETVRGLLIGPFLLGSLAVAGPAWADDITRFNGFGGLFGCSQPDDVCIALDLRPQLADVLTVAVDDGVQGALGTHAAVHATDAIGYVCQCEGGSDQEDKLAQEDCGRDQCFQVADGLESARKAITMDGASVYLIAEAEEGVLFGGDGYLIFGQIDVTNATDLAGKACSATLRIREIVDLFDFSTTPINHNELVDISPGCLEREGPRD